MEILTVTVAKDLGFWEVWDMTSIPDFDDMLVVDRSACTIVRSNTLNFRGHDILLGVKNHASANIHSTVELAYPCSIAYKPPSSLYICESGFSCIKKYDIFTKSIEIIAGDTSISSHSKKNELGMDATKWAFNEPLKISLNADHSLLSILEANPCSIIVISLEDGKVIRNYNGDFPEFQDVLTTDFAGCVDTLFFANPSGVNFIEIEANTASVSATSASRSSSKSAGAMLLCGNRNSVCGYRDGPHHYARFNRICSMVSNTHGTKIYMSDLFNNVIRMFDFESYTVSTVAGLKHKGGIASADANFCYPFRICWINNGKDLAVVNRTNNASISIINGLGLEVQEDLNTDRLLKCVSTFKFHPDMI